MLEDKIVIVTGGCSGIGWGISQRCAALGATVIAGQRSQNGRERIQSLAESGMNAHFLTLDVSDPASISRFTMAVIEQFGRIDSLVNNAGITIESDFLDFPLEQLDQLWTTNLRSVFLMSQAAARHMRTAGKGAIVNISSNHSHASVPGYEMYAATKGGISAMTRAMAWSLGPLGIRVNTLSPGLTLTESVAEVMESRPGLDAAFKSLQATREVSSVGDIANIAAFLVSDDARGLSGADIIADQGTAALLCKTDELK